MPQWPRVGYIRDDVEVLSLHGIQQRPDTRLSVSKKGKESWGNKKGWGRRERRHMLSSKPLKSSAFMAGLKRSREAEVRL